MATRTLIKEEHGVRLEWVEVPIRPGKAGGPHFRISSKRNWAPRVRVDPDDAERVWAAEVEASRADPRVAKILAAGL